MNQEEFISGICKEDYLNIFTSDNVVSIGFSYKIMKGKDTGIPCIQVGLKEKLLENAVSKASLIPKTYRGMFTDVVEVGEMKPYTFDETVRPLIGGYAVGRQNWDAMGTYGGPMEGGRSGNLKKYALSNNHVLGGGNTVLKNTNVYQTAYALDQNPMNIIGNVKKYIPVIAETFIGSGTPANRVDCAVGLSSKDEIYVNNIKNIGAILDLGIPKVGMKIIKSGRTTETTRGVLTATNTTVRIVLDGVTYFTEQLMGNIVGAGGDSGGLLFEENTNKLIGILFAGGSNTVAFNDIRNVLSLLGIKAPTNNWEV